MCIFLKLNFMRRVVIRTRGNLEYLQKTEKAARDRDGKSSQSPASP